MDVSFWKVEAMPNEEPGKPSANGSNTIRKAPPKPVTPEHALYAARKIVIFIQGGDTLGKKALEDLSTVERKSVVEEGSSIVLSFLKRECVNAQWQMLSERVRRLAERALQKKAGMQQTCNAQMAVPSIEKVVMQVHTTGGGRKRTHFLSSNFTADPQCVAELYAQEWKREWRNEDAIGFNTEIVSVRAVREKHVAGARVWASSLGLRAVNIREACLSLPSKTAIGLDQHAFTDIAILTDNALDSLGENIRQCFVKLAIPTQVTFATFVLVGKKMEGAEPSPSCTQHTVSPCAWYQHTSVNGMSSLQLSGTLRSRAIQHSEHMSRGRWASSWPTMKVNM